jgi:hypothetical protein
MLNRITNTEITDDRLKYGKGREPIVLITLNELLGNTILPSRNKMSFFDFYCVKSRFLIELKSHRYTYAKYNTAVMNYSKLRYDKMLFLWDFPEPDGSRGLYYHIYDSDKKYNRRWMTSYVDYEVDVIDVEKCDITKFDSTNEYLLDTSITQVNIDKFNAFILEDARFRRY